MKLTDLADGLHHNIPDAIYHARIPALVSRTALDKFSKAPKVYEDWLAGAADEDTDALRFGRLLHCALLEPSVFARTYCVEPDFGDCRYKEAKAARDAWREENISKQPVTAAEHAAIIGMSASVRAHPFAAKMLSDGASEVTALWTDEATGLRCKARGDYHVPARRLLVDVKTCEDARPEAFERSVAKWGYHRQRAFYGDGFAACGAPIDHFIFLAVEKRRPYLCALHVLDLDGVARGRASVAKAMRDLNDCIRLGHFPGYSDHINTISVPQWAA